MATSIDGKIVGDIVDDDNHRVSRTCEVSTMVYRVHEEHMLGELKFTKMVRKGDAVVMLICISGLLIW